MVGILVSILGWPIFRSELPVSGNVLFRNHLRYQVFMAQRKHTKKNPMKNKAGQRKFLHPNAELRPKVEREVCDVLGMVTARNVETWHTC